jgi:hypothetical protein
MTMNLSLNELMSYTDWERQNPPLGTDCHSVPLE